MMAIHFLSSMGANTGREVSFPSVLSGLSIAGRLRGSRALLAMNQPGGFKCPSCAFPDPDCKKTLEFCENGAKAPAFEATKRRITLEFLAEHSVSELMEQSDYWLEMQGRLSSNWRAGSTLATSKGVACVQVLEKTQLAGDQRRPQLQQVPLPLSWIGGQATVP
jgi:hypothetical protein